MNKTVIIPEYYFEKDEHGNKKLKDEYADKVDRGITINSKGKGKEESIFMTLSKFEVNKNKLKLILLSIISDGGTKVYVDEKGQNYYLDNRIASTTKGKMYDKYPNDKDAKIIDNEEYEII